MKKCSDIIDMYEKFEDLENIYPNSYAEIEDDVLSFNCDIDDFLKLKIIWDNKNKYLVKLFYNGIEMDKYIFNLKDIKDLKKIGKIINKIKKRSPNEDVLIFKKFLLLGYKESKEKRSIFFYLLDTSSKLPFLRDRVYMICLKNDGKYNDYYRDDYDDNKICDIKVLDYVPLDYVKTKKPIPIYFNEYGDFFGLDNCSENKGKFIIAKDCHLDKIVLCFYVESEEERRKNNKENKGFLFKSKEDKIFISENRWNIYPTYRAWDIF